MKRVNTYWSSDATLHEPRHENPRQPEPLSHWTPLWFAVALFVLAILLALFGVGCVAPAALPPPATGERDFQQRMATDPGYACRIHAPAKCTPGYDFGKCVSDERAKCPPCTGPCY